MTNHSQSTDDINATTNVSVPDAVLREWDVVVIGAGLSGSLVAVNAARAGLSVLLLDAKAKGRKKVCGGCLNQTAWSVLQRYDIADSVRQAGSQQLTSIQFTFHHRSATWPMPPMESISRTALDPILIDRAIDSGATFLPRVYASVLPVDDKRFRKVRLRQSGIVNSGMKTQTDAIVRGTVVVAADGLGHASLAKSDDISETVSVGSRIGVGTTFMSPANGHPDQQLNMVAGNAGYVGQARAENGLLSVAAAIDQKLLRESGNNIGEAVSQILRDARMRIPDGIQEADWIGTPKLTRSSRLVSGHRLLLVGDAAGYVEPFTGEGMAWALVSAEQVSPIVKRGVSNWSTQLEREWQADWKSSVRGKQLRCRLLATALRSPRIAAMSLPLVARIKNFPTLLFPESTFNQRIETSNS